MQSSHTLIQRPWRLQKYNLQSWYAKGYNCLLSTELVCAFSVRLVSRSSRLRPLAAGQLRTLDVFSLTRTQRTTLRTKYTNGWCNIGSVVTYKLHIHINWTIEAQPLDNSSVRFTVFVIQLLNVYRWRLRRVLHNRAEQQPRECQRSFLFAIPCFSSGRPDQTGYSLTGLTTSKARLSNFIA